MMEITAKSIVKISILLIVISITRGNPTPIKVQTKMEIAGSLNKICENDLTSSDKLPSCDCLNKFTVQSQIHASQYRGVVNPEEFLRTSYGYDDSYDRIYEKPEFGRLGITGVTKTAGLKCVDNNGDEVELNPIYNYLTYMVITNSHTPNDYFTVDRPPNDPSSEESGIIYKQDINNDTPIYVTKAAVTINDTLVKEFNNLGSGCKPEYPRRSLETNVWTIMNSIALNGSTTCNIPKDTYYAISSIKHAVLSLHEPLQCGQYEVSVDYIPEGEVFGVRFYANFNLMYNIFCAPIEADLIEA